MEEGKVEDRGPPQLGEHQIPPREGDGSLAHFHQQPVVDGVFLKDRYGEPERGGVNGSR
jgi:hypothetical protein